MPPLVRLEAVSKSFAGRAVIRTTTLEVGSSERLALIGPSGCGKSTLLKMILGLVVPDAGTVHVGDVIVNAQTAREVRRRIGYVIQDGGLFPHLTAEQNVTLVARLDGANANHLQNKVNELSELAHLSASHLARYPRELSGGERQRVGLMRALMLDPDVLLLDEPLGALDPIVRAKLQEDLRNAFRALKKCVIFVTHDLGEAAYLADSIAIVHDGKMLQKGSMHELVDSPADPFVSEFVGAQRSLAEALRWKRCIFLILMISLFFPCISRADDVVKIGSKRFTESYIVAEIIVGLIDANGGSAKHEQGLGATAVAFRALEDGQIDALPEYTGTLAEAIVQSHDGRLESLRAALAPKGFSISDPIGFENTFALAVTKKKAAALGLKTVSDLKAHLDLKFGLSNEFVGRTDGWPGLSAKYDLHPQNISSMDHALSYEAIANGTVDVVDAYTTDAKIARYDLLPLIDDRAFFPAYEAVLVYRTDLPKQSAAFAKMLTQIPNLIDAAAMQKMNARAELDHVSFDRIASDFLAKKNGGAADTSTTHRSFALGLWNAVVEYGPRHLELVFVSLFLSTLLGVPLGIWAYAKPRAGGTILAITGVVQTIPSLALFCFFIPLLGIGVIPALAALFLYGLLPIVRNTHAGLSSIASDLREAAVALGLTAMERLRYVELPLASRTILAGIKTSAVVAVGSATIAAFIGAGGFGEPISTGLSLNDVPIILQGAIPAAGLALLVQGFFELAEAKVLPRSLR